VAKNGSIPRSELPVPYRKFNKREMMKTPKWMDDERVMTRILSVWKEYNERMDIASIARHHLVSISQIYKDLRRARELFRLEMSEKIFDIVLEQIERRNLIIANAHQEITRLRRSAVTAIFELDKANVIDDETKEHLRDLLPPDPTSSQAVAALLKVVSGEETKIEELLGLRERGGKASDRMMPEEEQEQYTGKGIVIDARVTIRK